MNIIYKHKETGAKVSLEDIKKNPDLEGGTYKDIFAYKNGKKVMSFPKIYSYQLRDIPLSDDFELVIEDNPYDFDVYEIHVLLQALELFPYLTANEEKLKCKLIKVYNNLRKGEIR